MPIEEINKKLEEEFEKYKASVQKPSILLAGGTGVGKSSLVNKIFGKNLAKAGIGIPITNTIEKYEDNDVGVILFDSPGYEIGSEKNEAFKSEVLDIKENINLVWYCIAATGNRITDYDIEAVKKFRENGLVVNIIFTKSDAVSEDTINQLKSTANKELANIKVYEMSTVIKHKIFEEELNKLINDSISLLPEQLKDGFISAQKVSLKEKWNRAHNIILQHITSSFAVGFIPIPFADAPVLMANQIGMIVRILYVYDLKGLENMLKAGGGASVVGQIMSMIGKSASGQLLKLIPGVGTAVGGAINGGIASVLTSGLGEAINISCYKLHESILNGNTNIEDQVSAFGDVVIKYAKEYIETKKDKNDYKLPD